MSNAPKDLMFFHRITLVLSKVLSLIPAYATKSSILFLMSSVCSRIRKNHKAVLLIIFARILVAYISDKDILSDENRDLN